MIMMPQARWIICEQSGRWAALLRPMVAGWRASWREVRAPAECLEALTEAPTSFVTLELSPPRIDAGLDLLAAIQTGFPRACAAVVAARELAEYECLTRELGAVVFETSPRRLAPLVAAARRRFEAAGNDERTLVERIRADLPWS